MITDIHSHILPGMDDGSASVEESLEMLRELARQGIDHVVATPHFYPDQDTPERFLARRAEAMARLEEAVDREPGLPRIRMGAEVFFFHGISDSEALVQLTMDNKCSILIEMPEAPWTEKMYRELENIRVKQGIIPVIAHVDRYISPFRTHKIPQRLEMLPVLVQANAGFFLSRKTRKMALRMLQSDQIHLLGSDCHNLHDRAPRLGEAVWLIRKELGDAALCRIREYENSIF